MLNGEAAEFHYPESTSGRTFHLTQDVITIEQTDYCKHWGAEGTTFDGEEYGRG